MTDNTENKRIAFVSGATRGIGRAAAVALAKSGCHVILSGRTAGALEEVDDEIRSAGGTASILKLNLLNAERLDALGPSLYERWQKLDVIVAAAGANSLVAGSAGFKGGKPEAYRANISAIRNAAALARGEAA